MILEQLAKGTVTLTTIRLLAPHLTEANHATLLVEARDRTKREVEEIIARLHPKPDVPASVRKLPTSTPSRDASVLPPPARADTPGERTTAQPEARSDGSSHEGTRASTSSRISRERWRAPPPNGDDEPTLSQ